MTGQRSNTCTGESGVGAGTMTLTSGSGATDGDWIDRGVEFSLVVAVVGFVSAVEGSKASISFL
jgi:hypothetical protein